MKSIILALAIAAVCSASCGNNSENNMNDQGYDSTQTTSPDSMRNMPDSSNMDSTNRPMVDSPARG